MFARWLTFGVCLSMLVLGGAANAGGLRCGGASWDLGSDPDATILRFDISGGQRPRGKDGPQLDVRASGAVSARATRPGDPRVLGRMSDGELSALLDALILELGAFDIDEEAIRTQILASGALPPRFVDASTTSLMLSVCKRSHSVSVQALARMAKQYPQIDALGRFLAISRLLNAHAAALAHRSVVD